MLEVSSVLSSGLRLELISDVAAPGGYSSTITKSQSSGERDTWSSMGSGVSLGWPASSLGGSVWGAPDSDQHNRTTPLNSFLPPDLLSENL